MKRIIIILALLVTIAYLTITEQAVTEKQAEAKRMAMYCQLNDFIPQECQRQ